MLEEVGREDKDNKEPTIIVMLDAQYAFDVVRHANLIRRLYHIQSRARTHAILVIGLYELLGNPTT